MRHVAAIPAVGLLAGAAVGLLVAHPPFVPAFVLISTSVAAATFAWALRYPLLLAVSVAIGFFAGGVLLSFDAWQHAWRPSLRIAFEELARAERAQAEAEGRRLPEDDEAFAVVEGVLRSDAARTESGVSLSVQVDGMERPEGSTRSAKAFAFAEAMADGRSLAQSRLAERTTGGILVTVVGSLAAERMGGWRAGRRVRVPVQLRRPSRYLDPGVPDHERALARRGTTLVGSVKSGALVEVLARGALLDEAMGKARAFARQAIADAVGRWSAQSGAIVAAIVIGDRAGLDADVQRVLQEAGTYHVIAISGGNIAILAGLLLGAFRLAGWLGRTAMIASIATLLAYARFVGDGASVDRATLMALVYFGARAFDHRSPPLNALAVVAAVLVATDPLSVADPAFVLTFGATLAILVIVPVVTAWNAKPAKDAKKPDGFAVFASFAFKDSLFAMFAASAAAEALLFPVGAIVFSRVTFAGLALNFLAIPLMAVAQIAGMAVVPAAIVSAGGAAALGWIAHLGAAGLVRSADLVRFAPALTYRVAPPSWIAVGLYYSAAVTWWTLWRRNVALGSPPVARGALVTRGALLARGFGRAIPRTAALVACGAALWILVPPRMLAAAHGDGTLHVTFLDVGQGDSIFVVFPRGSTLLVDAGGLSFSSAFDIGDRVVAPVVRDAGFRRLDYVALTHGDPDHIGGAASIVREFRPREVWEGIPVPRFEPLTALRVAAQAAGARWANVYRGDHIVVDGVEIVARHPASADWERQKVRNDDSIVLELRWREVSVLLTGDIGRAVEHVLATAISPAHLRIVKIPHHGSLTSSTPEFLNAVRPRMAIASAGRGNHFGHPAPDVLDRYTAIGAEVFRTDRDGAVMVDTDGHSIDVHTFAGRHLSLR
jgi:competence protein ComEC